MLDDSYLQFAEQLGGKAAQPKSWAPHPQLVTREVLADCKGPEAEWLMQDSQLGEELLPVAEEEGHTADSSATPRLSPPGAQSDQAAAPAEHESDEQGGFGGSSIREAVEKAAATAGTGEEQLESPCSCSSSVAAGEPADGAGAEAEGQSDSTLPWGQLEQQRGQVGEEEQKGIVYTQTQQEQQQQQHLGQQQGQQQIAYEEGSLPGSGFSSLLSSPDQPALDDLPPGFGGAAQEYGQQEQQEQERCVGRVHSPPSGFLNPVFEGDNGEKEGLCLEASEEEPFSGTLSASLLLTPDNRGGMLAGARITPGATPGQSSSYSTPLPEEKAAGGSFRTMAVAERSRSLETQLLFAGVGREAAGPAPVEVATLQQLQARLATVEAEAAQLREEKAAAEMQAAALLDEVQLSFAALEASQAARAQAVAQQAQASSALQSALAEQQVLAAQLDAGRQELEGAQQTIQRLQYKLELMQAEWQEVGGGEGERHPSSEYSSTEGMAGGELLAEVALLRAQLSEANRSKAVLATKLQACRADCGALAARLQASQARAGADLARQAAAAEEGSGALRAQAAQLRAEVLQLEAQVQLLQRQAASGADSERAAALAGIVRQREEQLVQAHLEITQLQAGLREAAAAEERCVALEARVDLLLRQQEALTDRLRSAQEETASWRSALSRLSDEMAACTEREAAAKSALQDTAVKLLAQQQLCEAQSDELEHLRAKAGRSLASPPPQQQQQQQAQQVQHVLPAQQVQQDQERPWQHWSASSSIGQEVSPSAARASAMANAGEPRGQELPAVHGGQWGLPLPGAGPWSEDDGSPRSRKSSSSKSSWGWLKFKTSGQ